MISRLRSVNIDFNAILKGVLQAHTTDLAELNKEQLREGKRSDDSQILPAYSPSYQKRKRRSPTPVILFDTGDFQDGFKQTFTSDGFTMKSDDVKNDTLIDKYGSKIHGLTKKSRIKLLGERGVRKEFVRGVKRRFNNV